MGTRPPAISLVLRLPSAVARIQGDSYWHCCLHATSAQAASLQFFSQSGFKPSGSPSEPLLAESKMRPGAAQLNATPVQTYASAGHAMSQALDQGLACMVSGQCKACICLVGPDLPSLSRKIRTELHECMTHKQLVPRLSGRSLGLGSAFRTHCHGHHVCAAAECHRRVSCLGLPESAQALPLQANNLQSQ